MTLASRFLIASIENASSEVVRAFFDEVRGMKLLQGKFSFCEGDLEELVREDGNHSRAGLVALRTVLRHPALAADESRNRRWLALVEGGLRLAALFHDLGHFPFSHDFEYALAGYLQKALAERKFTELAPLVRDVAPHEEIGHRLAELVLLNLVSSAPPAVRAMYSLAIEILNAKATYEYPASPPAGVLNWLHSLIDGEVDVDRADYILRDARALGFEFAAYDLERLIGNLELVKDDRFGFMSAVREQGLSAVESFYVSRARSTQLFIRHHKVTQAGAALRYVSQQALGTPEEQRLLNILCQLLSDTRKPPELLTAYAEFDDNWWYWVMRSLLPSKEPLLEACLLFVLRREQTLRSVWKRPGELDDDTHERLRNIVPYQDPAAWVSRIEQLRERNVIVVSHRFRPFGEVIGSKDESIVRILTKGGLQPASTYSPLMRSLKEAWGSDIKVHAFEPATQNSKPQEIVDALTK